jgi:hypothetical protein
MQNLTICGIPIDAAGDAMGRRIMLLLPRLLAGCLEKCHPPAQEHSPSSPAMRSGEHGPLSMLNHGLGWNAILHAIAINC